jgi:hypothetical protein
VREEARLSKGRILELGLILDGLCSARRLLRLCLRGRRFVCLRKLALLGFVDWVVGE